MHSIVIFLSFYNESLVLIGNYIDGIHQGSSNCEFVVPLDAMLGQPSQSHYQCDRRGDNGRSRERSIYKFELL